VKPVPQSIMLVLLLALCCLCAWQWHRESGLRTLASAHLATLASVTSQRDDLESRVKAADAEILRLTGTLAELRSNSVSKQVHEELSAANITMREGIEKQNTVGKEQNEMITKAGDAIRQANDSIKTITAERDSLATRLNEVTAKYNALAKKGGP
jgi:chromosome segregation ATPase